MAATDTVVGIVGAVLLVGVMTGVFVYEYNQVGDTGGGDFATAYPALAADGDIDGDGTPNAEDDDIDGDGTPNAEDDDVVVTFTFTGSGSAIAANEADLAVESVSIGQGAADATVTLTASTADPTQQTADVSADLVVGDATATAAAGGGDATTSVEGPADGSLRIYTQSVALNVSWEATVAIAYETA